MSIYSRKEPGCHVVQTSHVLMIVAGMWLSNAK